MAKPPQNCAKKLSKFVKQNSAGRPLGAENTPKNKWQRVDLNRRPRAYESPALPLSYAATSWQYIMLKLGCQFLLRTWTAVALKAA
jgi:hypothetical protein